MNVRSTLALAAVIVAGGFGFAACKGSSSSAAATLCEPGENIFCLCSGGEPGTKTCNPDGESFQACITESGNCPVPGSAPLLGIFASCMTPEQCQSNLCTSGLCTEPCATAGDCPSNAACATLAAGTVCLPSCNVYEVCDLYPGLSCTYVILSDGKTYESVCTVLVDGKVTFLSNISCTSNNQCNLGYAGTERVCSDAKCKTGCYAAHDCPDGKTCNSTGALGQCVTAGDGGAP